MNQLSLTTRFYRQRGTHNFAQVRRWALHGSCWGAILCGLYLCGGLRADEPTVRQQTENQQTENQQTENQQLSNPRLGNPGLDNPRLGSLNQVAVGAELKTVKLYGAGGSGLDAYQSGIFISAEGHILTVWSTVLDADEVVVLSSDGGRFTATVLGIDPNLEIAVLKANERPSSFFDLQAAVEAPVGSRVLAFSNLYGIASGSEMSSVQKGVIMARTQLRARRGSFESIYQGPVLVIDAMTNNPGAAGGALTSASGQLLGLLGKELRDADANTWLNYAIPISELRDSAERLMRGQAIDRAGSKRAVADRPINLRDLGVVLVPNILIKTPAFVDLIEAGSVADRAGLKSDDLILFVNSTRVTSQAALMAELKFVDQADDLTLLVQRGNELKEVVIGK